MARRDAIPPPRAVHFAVCAIAPAWLPRSRGKVLDAFARPLRIEDISDFVREQRARYTADGISALQTPRELTHPCAPATAALLGIDSSSVSPELTVATDRIRRCMSRGDPDNGHRSRLSRRCRRSKLRA